MGFTNTKPTGAFSDTEYAVTAPDIAWYE